MAAVAAVRVGSEREMEMAIASYIANGFVLSNRSPAGATMFKKKEFQIVWAVIGFFLCLLPLLIYLIIYATQSDQMVQIQLAPGGQPELPAPMPVQANQLVGQRSADGHWWWDGRAWQPVAQPTPSPQPAVQHPASDWLPAPEVAAEHPTDAGEVTSPQEADPAPPE